MPILDLIEPSPEVSEALSQGRAVVALESTIISHGLPEPLNLETAREAQRRIRECGAVPATIGLLDGRIKVGLGDAELERLGRREGVHKVSRRDLAGVLDDGLVGATTVAATMFVASLLGIRFQATGGIGGVHRGGQVSMDVSADLAELARTPVAVVCSGPKAVLDIGRTLEVLETLGVPVIGYRTIQCPAFYCRSSGHSLTRQVESPGEAARISKIQWDLGLGGVVFVNPVPEVNALEPGEVENAIQAALLQAERDGVAGRDVTPRLLQGVSQQIGQRCLDANVALYLNNACLAAEIACQQGG